MRGSRSIYWRWPAYFILALAGLLFFCRELKRVCHLRSQLSHSKSFVVRSDAFTVLAGLQKEMTFKIEQPLAGHGLFLSLEQEGQQLRESNGSLSDKMRDLQKAWGNLSGTVEILSASGESLHLLPLRLQHSLLDDYSGKFLPLAQLPTLPPGQYLLRTNILRAAQEELQPVVNLRLSCALCSLEYLPLVLARGGVLLAIIVSLLACYKLIECCFWFRRQRKQEKWLSEGVGQAKIIYLMTRYPLWSETFLRQDLQFLLKEGSPLEAMALFPGDCQAQPDWPIVRILQDSHEEAKTNSKSSSFWQLLRRLIPARVQCSLALLRHRALLRKLVEQGRQCHARHIHAEFADLGALLGAAAARRLAIPFSLGVHAADVYTNQYSLACLCRKAKFISVCNRTAGACLVRKCPRAAKKLHLIHHGLDIEQWPYREKWTFNKTAELFFVGRLVAKKGISLLLDAVALLLRRGRRLRLTLIGSGPMEEELREQCSELEIQEQLEWAGMLERKEVADRLRQADIFCLPSIESADRNQEGIPNVLVEAMALGVPVLGSQSGGISELLTVESGWPIDKLTAEALADTIEEMLRNPQECEKRRRLARKRVEEDFSAARTVKARRRLLEGLAAGKS